MADLGIIFLRKKHTINWYQSLFTIITESMPFRSFWATLYIRNVIALSHSTEHAELSHLWCPPVMSQITPDTLLHPLHPACTISFTSVQWRRFFFSRGHRGGGGRALGFRRGALELTQPPPPPAKKKTLLQKVLIFRRNKLTSKQQKKKKNVITSVGMGNSLASFLVWGGGGKPPKCTKAKL